MMCPAAMLTALSVRCSNTCLNIAATVRINNATVYAASQEALPASQRQYKTTHPDYATTEMLLAATCQLGANSKDTVELLQQLERTPEFLGAKDTSRLFRACGVEEGSGWEEVEAKIVPDAELESLSQLIGRLFADPNAG